MIDDSPADTEPEQVRMAEAARKRIEHAGGRLTIWGVLQEDRYETTFGDGLYLHARGVALNEADARRLADLPDDRNYRWHVRRYEIGIEDGEPTFLAPLKKPGEEFKIGDIIALLAEIAPGAAASKLYTGYQRAGSGPSISLPQD